MSNEWSIAIETSCRLGGIALGRGDQLIEVDDFDASSRHATQLLSRIDALLGRHGVRPGELGQAYVSAGPGSFTGLRIGVTVARTMGQMIQALRLVSVSTTWIVAQNAAVAEWQHLGVMLAAKEHTVYGQLFTRRGGQIEPADQARTAHVGDLLETWPRPLLVTGEALGYEHVAGPGVSVADAAVHMPAARSAWIVGRRLAQSGQFTDYNNLLPIYGRSPEAQRLWEKRQGQGTK